MFGSRNVLPQPFTAGLNFYIGYPPENLSAIFAIHGEVSEIALWSIEAL